MPKNYGPCEVPGCERPGLSRTHYGRFCAPHKRRIYLHGDAQADKPIGHRTHGKKKTPEYNSWIMMRARCNTPGATGYDYYGGRGIKVCPEWDLFEAFLRDMGPRPSSEHTLDRKDTDGDYTPSNCRWATKLEQTQNRNRRRAS